DFAALSNLEVASIIWNKHFRGLGACARLRELQLFRAGKGSPTFLSSLSGLRSVELLNSQLDSIEPIADLKQLRRVRLGLLPHIVSLEPVAALRSLDTFIMVKCNAVRSIAPLKACTKLKRVELIDCKQLESLHPIMGHRSIEHLLLGGSKIEDG